MSARRDTRRLGMLLAAPAAAAMLLVTALPIARAAWLSLFRLRLTDPAGGAFVGLANYRVVLGDPLWWRDVATTAALTVGCVAVEVALGLALALLMDRAPARRAVRAAVLVPYGVVTVVSGLAWRYAFAVDTGFVDRWLGAGRFAWLGHPASALAAIAVADVWKTTPFVALLLLAGLSQVPREVLEAAVVDGAGPWRRLFGVTLPAMRSAVGVAVLFRTLDAWRIFDTVFVMTAGAEGTETVSFLAYRQTVTRTALGLGSAVSVLLFLAAALLAAALVRGLRVDLVAEGRG
jgi:multiple sugar transport system permease protein